MTKLERVKIEDPEDSTKSEESLLHLVLHSPTCEDTESHNAAVWIIVAIIIVVIFFALIYFTCGSSGFDFGSGFLWAIVIFVVIFFIIAASCTHSNNKTKNCYPVK